METWKVIVYMMTMPGCFWSSLHCSKTKRTNRIQSQSSVIIIIMCMVFGNWADLFCTKINPSFLVNNATHVIIILRLEWTALFRFRHKHCYQNYKSIVLSIYILFQVRKSSWPFFRLGRGWVNLRLLENANIYSPKKMEFDRYL